jgi:hypothetical protein
MFTALCNLKYKRIKYFIYLYVTDRCSHNQGNYLKPINLLIVFLLSRDESDCRRVFDW